MSRTKFSILIGVLVCNFAALTLLAFAIVRRQRSPAPGTISIQLGPQNLQNGILLREDPKDASAEVAHIGGSDCRVARRPKSGGPCYMYFSIEPALKRPGLMDVLVTVEYFDQVPGEFKLNYDAMDLARNQPSTYMTAEDKGQCLGSNQWRTAYFIAHNARFQNSEHGADFRIELRIPELYVRRVAIQQLNEKANR